MMTSPLATTPSPDPIDIGPTDSFDIRGPRRFRSRSAMPSVAGAVAICAVLAVAVVLTGGALPIAIGSGVASVLVALIEVSYLRGSVRFQLTYDFLRLPDLSVRSWHNISDLQLAPDGETLLIWVFQTPSARGERSESDPVRAEPDAVSLKGWPYPPAEIVATLTAQFEKYLAEVATDD